MDKSTSKRSIGIDLGTTNCAVAYAEDISSATDVSVPQITHPGTVESRPMLPSFIYLPTDHEITGGALALPWDKDGKVVVGEYAREHGVQVPHRLISSAKSWLCFDGANRRSQILPWKSSEDVSKLSPVEASAYYLRHIREAWNAAFSDFVLADQEIVLTVPASFDVVARELTVEAAHQSGLEKVTLLEEPQAALYAWLHTKGNSWRKLVTVGDLILVCDIGGGTTDFSLIAVSEEDGNLVLDRVAVGDHILLGGDNMDLALAVAVGSRLKAEGTKLDNWQFQCLTYACRVAKEKLLSDTDVLTDPILIPGRGSSLIGGSINTELTKEEVVAVILDGFFPRCKPSDHAQRTRKLGLAELGLPYEADAAITRHLAGFLGQNGSTEGKKKIAFARPTAILFNGGVTKASLVRERLTATLNDWLESAHADPVRELVNDDAERAVARGAAYYGMVRHGQGIRIRGGTTRAYYMGVEVARPAVPGVAPAIKAVCVARLGMEEGTQADLPGQEFGLVVGEPAEFRFLASSSRREDQVGVTVEEWEEDEIADIATLSVTLKGEGVAGTRIPVQLRSAITEVGTLELTCVEKDGPGKWKLEFEVREREPAVT